MSDDQKEKSPQSKPDFQLMSIFDPAQGFDIGFAKRGGDPHDLMFKIRYTDLKDALGDLEAIIKHCNNGIAELSRLAGVRHGVEYANRLMLQKQMGTENQENRSVQVDTIEATADLENQVRIDDIEDKFH
jgi:hypothetical protein